MWIALRQMKWMMLQKDKVVLYGIWNIGFMLLRSRF